MKRVREEEEICYEGRNGFEIAKLVCVYGFCCVNDMRMFGKSLNKAFSEWTRRYVYDQGIFTWSCSSTTVSECYHKSFIGVAVLRHEILKLRPHQWFHVNHVIFKFDPKEWQISNILCLAATMVSSEPLDIHYLAVLLSNGGKECTVVQVIDGLQLELKVEHNHQPGSYEFRICMKWKDKTPQ